MRNPTKDKFWGWRMYPFEVYAYWDSWRTSPNLTLTLTLRAERPKGEVHRFEQNAGASPKSRALICSPRWQGEPISR